LFSIDHSNFLTDLPFIFTARDQRPTFFGGAESMERTVNSLFVTKYGRGTLIFSFYILLLYILFHRQKKARGRGEAGRKS
jgi:hypothetical protein